MDEFVVVGNEMKYRAHSDYRQCSHSDADICGVCDVDRYYATTYPGVPWAETTPVPQS